MPLRPSARLLVLAFALAGPAAAQEPTGLPPGIDLSALLGGNVTLGGPKAEMRYVVGSVASLRFLGETVPGPTFADGEMVEFLVTEGSVTRVKKGDRYGWVPNAALSLEPPVPAAGAAPNPLLGGTTPVVPVPVVPPAPPRAPPAPNP